jgi:hypothetical protein
MFFDFLLVVLQSLPQLEFRGFQSAAGHQSR